ncbi:hypothetical protein EDC01DRAFT_661531 [Geopyxis carbonaria]|nr:hypothetical protein EDC01DRAFT_661531 [Geopyxis carbonaria]
MYRSAFRPTTQLAPARIVHRSITVLSTAKPAPYAVQRPTADTPAEVRAVELRAKGVQEMYPKYWYDDAVKRTKTVHINYRNIETNQILKKDVVTIKGRIRNIRDVSSKLIFYDIVEDGRSLQVVNNYSMVGGDVALFKVRATAVRIGDIVTVTGHPGRTNAGELSIFANSHIQLLTPCLRAVPKEMTVEQRLHHRHLDLLTSPHAAKILRLRSRIIHHMRRNFFLRDFVEVQTPILSYDAGGALAKPFFTEATSAYRGRKLALRIAPELWLKRLVVGGLDRVFEIGPQFRNEHIDATHNPEFTTAEFYQAYSNLHSLMETTEWLLRDIAKLVVELKEPEGPCHGLPADTVDWAPAFQRISFIPKLEQLTGHKLPDLDDRPVADVTADLLEYLTTVGLPHPPQPTPAKILDKLASHFLEPLCDVPTFLTHHPEALSPLSKTEVRDGRRVALRFELFVGGKELVNAYEEENDPRAQRRKFEMQGPGAVDEAYLEALETGLPPTGGWGLGVDRLVMLFAGAERIADVLAFGGLRGAVNQGGVVNHGMRERDRGEKEKGVEVEGDKGQKERLKKVEESPPPDCII